MDSEQRRTERAARTAIELRHLRYFVAVSEELHFGRAAERLHIAQPPLSQAIRKLEDELGVQLLERTSRAVAPTEAGRVFAEEARRVLAGFEFAVSEARRAGETGAPLRIGSLPDLPIGWLLRFLEALEERQPEVATRVTHASALEQVRLLRSGELDLGIFHYAEDHEGLTLEPLFAGQPLAAFLPSDHPLAEKDVLRPDDLQGETLMLFPRTGNPALHDGRLQQLEGAGYRFRTVRETGGMTARDVLLAVVGGPGVAVATFSLKEASEAATLVVRRPLDPPLRAPDTVLAWRESPSRRLRPVLATARAVAAQLRRETEAETADGASGAAGGFG